MSNNFQFPISNIQFQISNIKRNMSENERKILGPLQVAGMVALDMLTPAEQAIVRQYFEEIDKLEQIYGPVGDDEQKMDWLYGMVDTNIPGSVKALEKMQSLQDRVLRGGRDS